MEFMKSILIAFSLISIVSAASCPVYTVQVIQGTSSDAAGLTPVVDAYRALLGGIDNGNNAGPFGSGQRSVSLAFVIPVCSTFLGNGSCDQYFESKSSHFFRI